MAADGNAQGGKTAQKYQLPAMRGSTQADFYGLESHRIDGRKSRENQADEQKKTVESSDGQDSICCLRGDRPMTIERHSSRQHITCDSCPAAQAQTYDADDFQVMTTDARADGWQFVKTGQGWEHHCPDCRGSNKQQRRLI
jgi:hypothetical protein